LGTGAGPVAFGCRHDLVVGDGGTSALSHALHFGLFVRNEVKPE